MSSFVFTASEMVLGDFDNGMWGCGELRAPLMALGPDSVRAARAVCVLLDCGPGGGGGRHRAPALERRQEAARGLGRMERALGFRPGFDSWL